MDPVIAVLALWFAKTPATTPPEGICDDPPETRAPACELAATIGSVATDHPLWEGEDGIVATALDLGVIAKHESSLDPRVIACDRKGDGGLSITAFQVRRGSWMGYAPDDLCADTELATKVALGHLRKSAHGSTWTGEALLLNYGGWVRPPIRLWGTDGPLEPTKGARELAKAWKDAMARFGLREAALVRRAEDVRSVVPRKAPTAT